MKYRRSHVTNSSSSSFIISRNDITKDKLIPILLEIANEERLKKWDDDDEYLYTLEGDVKEEPGYYNRYGYYHNPKTSVAYRYNITEATEDNPYEDWNDIRYTNDFIIDNDSCVRYNWDIIKEVLDKYGISWSYGYCD